MGWIGSTHQVEYALKVVNADRDENGKFMIFGEQPPVTFMGMGDEMAIGDDLSYSCDGQRMSLAGLMRSTSYGVGVNVI